MSKTKARLAELQRVRPSDVLRAAADLLEGDEDAWDSFQKPKPDGWAVMIGGECLPHRALIARATWYATKRDGATAIKRTTDDFEGNGLEYQPVLKDDLHLNVVDI
jgi:hypothetical protein